MVSLYDGVLCRNVRHGSGAGRKQAPCPIFQLLTDSLDHHHRHYHDSHGSGKHLRRQERRQEPRPRQALRQDTHCGCVDSSSPLYRKACHRRHSRTSCGHHKHQLPHMGSLHHLHGGVRLSSFPAWNRHPLTGEVHRRLP